jgi:phage terminase small subunit
MPSGAVVIHPLLSIKNRAQRDLLRVASELGLSPAGRVGLQGVEPLDEADLAIMEKYNLVGTMDRTSC